MSTERSLILLKPDCVTKAHCGEVIDRFEKAGFRIRGAKMIQLSNELLVEHYSHVADKPFFPSIVAFMQSAPVIALVLFNPDKSFYYMRHTCQLNNRSVLMAHTSTLCLSLSL